MASTPLYIRLVKSARKFLRGKLMRRFPWVVKAVKPLFKKDYWVPTPHRMGLGLSIGLFFAFAMLVVPVQMICAAFTCLFLRANLPVALGACWVSNPFTIPPLVYGMVSVGEFLGKHGVSIGNENTVTIPVIEVTVNYGHFIVGCVFSGIVVALIAYPVYLGVWLLLPKSGKPRT